VSQMIESGEALVIYATASYRRPILFKYAPKTAFPIPVISPDWQKSDGLEVDDPTNDRFYVPLDKAGESDIEGGLLSMFYRPVEFYVDWSEQAVAAMKELHGNGGVFRNPQFLFQTRD
jgi:hypothetical protein